MSSSAKADSSLSPGRTGRGRCVKALLRVGIAVPVLVAVMPAAAAASPAGIAAAGRLRVSCAATVTNRYPKDGSDVGIKVSTAPSAWITVVAHFRTGSSKKTSRAYGNGRRTVWYRVGHARPGYRVTVDVRVSRFGKKASCSTWFTPRKVVRRHRRRRHAAWCRATAKVYNARYDENNVYVHSNQPYKKATASADGYSWSYETNGSGYALIYLNGPPPGAQITVTVGKAVCYTSD